jgi:hypothetical protein
MTDQKEALPTQKSSDVDFYEALADKYGVGFAQWFTDQLTRKQG